MSTRTKSYIFLILFIIVAVVLVEWTHHGLILSLGLLLAIPVYPLCLYLSNVLYQKRFRSQLNELGYTSRTSHEDLKVYLQSFTERSCFMGQEASALSFEFDTVLEKSYPDFKMVMIYGRLIFLRGSRYSTEFRQTLAMVFLANQSIPNFRIVSQSLLGRLRKKTHPYLLADPSWPTIEDTPVNAKLGIKILAENPSAARQLLSQELTVLLAPLISGIVDAGRNVILIYPPLKKIKPANLDKFEKNCVGIAEIFAKKQPGVVFE